MAGMKTLGKNVQYSITGNKLTIEIDLSKEHGASASGKTITVATTSGNKNIGGPGPQPTFIGLNAYRYPDEKKAKAKK